jgi:hypothetical protein
MDHPVFGEIVWDNLRAWRGRVQLDFFAGYDTTASAESAARMARADWQRAPDERHRRGDFELCDICPDGGEPSASQQSAFASFLQQREPICSAVADAIFDYYQTNWGTWRGEYGDDLTIPELRSREELKRVIRLGTLYVLDAVPGGAVLGFCFDCSWDVEHGLGVLVRAGRVIELSENAIAWSGPTGRGLPVGRRAELTDQITEQKALATIKKLGGSVSLDFNAAEPAKPTMRVDMAGKQTTGPVLEALRHCQSLRDLVLARTPLTDAGLYELRGLRDLEKLDLSGTAITDDGLKGLRGYKNLSNLLLFGTGITDTGLAELRAHKSLVVLYLGDTKVTDIGLGQLRELRELQQLELSGTGITDAGLRELRDLKSLVLLHLARTAVTGVGLRDYPKLAFLDLEATRLGDAGLRELGELKGLRVLNLSHCNITDAGLESLKGLTSLRTLTLWSTAVTGPRVVELTRVLPRLHVQR